MVVVIDCAMLMNVRLEQRVNYIQESSFDQSELHSGAMAVTE